MQHTVEENGRENPKEQKGSRHKSSSRERTMSSRRQWDADVLQRAGVHEEGMTADWVFPV